MSKQQPQELEKLIQDPYWRLSNIYRIVDKEGRVIDFQPTEYQRRIMHAVYRLGQKRHIILKARRMGMSTLIDLMLFDMAYWNRHIQCSIVDLTQGDASEKLKTKCRFAWENLPRDIKQPLDADSQKQLAFTNGSTINAGKNARGGTNQFLHVSELGPIAYADPGRAEEVLTGAIPSADTGIILVESTFKGGRGGAFFNMIRQAMETPVEAKTEKDFHFHFFPWHEDPRHTLTGDVAQVDAETKTYLDGLEETLKRKLTPGQRLWYFKVRKEQGIFMWREYPSLVEEAFKAPVEGSIYADILDSIRGEGRISPVSYDRGYPVYTSWDLGWADSTAVWVFQLVGREVLWLKYLEAKHETAAGMANRLRELGLPYAKHYLPHDGGAVKGGSGLSYKGELEKAGLVNIDIVPRTRDIWIGIDQLRNLLYKSNFDRDGCKQGIECLEAYHTRDNSSGGVIGREPVHDWSSHGADAARTAAEALNTGMVRDSSSLSRGARRRPSQAISAKPSYGAKPRRDPSIKMCGTTFTMSHGIDHCDPWDMPTQRPRPKSAKSGWVRD